MGAWSHEPFGNDDACDWAWELVEGTDLSPVEEALDTVLDADEYIERTEGSNAVAAVEVLAKVRGAGTQSDPYTEQIDAWIAQHELSVSAELVAKGLRALERVAGPDSEVAELWAEADDAGPWLASLDRLRHALTG